MFTRANLFSLARRPGSLGALSLILSESGGNITEMAAHNTSEGFAVDMFSIANLERINDEARGTHAPAATAWMQRCRIRRAQTRRRGCRSITRRAARKTAT